MTEKKFSVSVVGLEELLRRAKDVHMTPEEQDEQLRSWVFGNVALSNPAVTKEMVDSVVDELKRVR